MNEMRKTIKTNLAHFSWFPILYPSCYLANSTPGSPPYFEISEMTTHYPTFETTSGVLPSYYAHEYISL
jgi:hypothetical protein